MSRCFPFPPPGYVKKPSSVQEDLLAKEKHKEKKRKREKKDKDRSESRDKHKEKKEKKEKHKDKKKAKDNGKIGSSSDQKNETLKANEIKDSKFTGELERRIRDEEQGSRNHMVEKTFNTINRRTEINIPSTSTAMGKDACTNNNTAADASVSMRRKIDVRVPPFQQKGTNGFEISSTITEKQKIGSSEKIQDFTFLEKRRNDNCTPPFDIKRTVGVQVPGIEKQKIGDSEKSLAQPTNGRHVPPLHHKKPEGIEKQKFGGSEKKLTPPVQRCLESTQNKKAQINQKVGDFATEQRRNHVSIPRPFNRSPTQKNESVLAVNSMQKATSNNFVSNSISPYKKRNDELDNLVENITSVFQNTGAAQATDNERLFSNIASTESRDRSKEKKSEDTKKEGRHKDRGEKEKKRKDKDKDRHRDKRKEEKNNSKGEQKHVNHDKLKEAGRKDQTDHINGKVTSKSMPSTTASLADGLNKKRKESEINGFLHEPQLEERPNKIQRTTASSSQQFVDNGKPLEFDHMASKPMSTNNIKVVRGIENNGSSVNRNSNVEHQPLHIHKPPTVPPVVPIAIDSKKTSSVVESSKKDRVKDRIKTRPPHPDMKYLDLIYSMPKVEEVPESDEQDWILSSKRDTKRKIEVNESPPEVWAKGLRIEEADVFALPYVVPF